MKLGKLVIYLFCAQFIFIGCSKQPKCSDKDVKKLVVETIKKHINDTIEKEFQSENRINEEYYSYLEKILEERTELINQLELKLFSIKTDVIEKEIKKCDCQAKISAIEKSNILEIEGRTKRNFENQKYNIVGVNPVIKYSIQINDEGILFVNILNPEDIEIYTKNIMLKLMYKLKLKIESIEKYEN
jgi:ssDNA-binding Zn-finger/Zn-ribbon topoisomerase 1